MLEFKTRVQKFLISEMEVVFAQLSNNIDDNPSTSVAL
jgi:hypothetical protein